MQNEQLEQFKKWFDDYAAGFYGDDQFINANVRLKQDHTHRTCREMLYLADRLDLDDNQRFIAETIALFHDLGRFEQFVKYRTYKDTVSINHCLLSLQVLREHNILTNLDDSRQRIIESAIEFHGEKQLPADIAADAVLFAKLIRDADKLDIYNVVIAGYKLYARDPDNFQYELEFTETDECSQYVVDDILNDRRTNYSRLRTMNDARLLQIGWVYDVNFVAALERIKQREFLETLFEFLPKTDQIEKVRSHIFEYVNRRIRNEGNMKN